MTVEVTAKSVIPRDVSLTLNGSAQLLVAANSNRTHLQFQAPSGGNMAYSYTNASCGAPGTPTTGCFILAAGATWSPGFGLVGSAIYVNGTNTQLCVATEC